MANKRDLKKDLNYVFGDIIEAAYLHQLANPKEDSKKTEAIVNEAIQGFDELIVKVNQRGVENSKEHFSGISKELEERAQNLIEKVNAL